MGGGSPVTKQGSKNCCQGRIPGLPQKEGLLPPLVASATLHREPGISPGCPVLGQHWEGGHWGWAQEEVAWNQQAEPPLEGVCQGASGGGGQPSAKQQS